MALDLDRILADLDSRLDPAWAESAARRITRAMRYEEVDYLPVTLQCRLDPWHVVEAREYCWEKEKCLIYRLTGLRNGILLGDDRMPWVATLPDCGLIPSLFDANIIIHRKNHWIRPVGDRKAIEKLIEHGVPDLLDGRGWKVVTDCEFFLEALGAYPNLRRFVKVGFADVQGPLDNAYLLAGDDIYYWLADAPELVDGLVNLLTDTQLAWFEMLEQRFSKAFEEGRASHLALGSARVHLVVDDCDLISPEMYDRFSRPANERIFARYGNRGSVHFCGKSRAIQDRILETKGVVATDICLMPKPDDPEFPSTIDRFRQRKIGFQYCRGGTRVIRKGGPEGMDTGVHQFVSVESLEAGRALMKDLRNGG